MDAHFFQAKSTTLLDERETSTVNWYVLQSTKVGESQINIKWRTEVEEKKFLFAVYTADESGSKNVVWKPFETDKVEDEEPLTIFPDHVGQEYFHKVVNYCNADLTIQYENMNHISVKQYEEETYIRRQLELLVDLYTQKVLDEGHFRNWFNLFKISFNIKNQHFILLEALLDKKREDLISWEEFRVYYDELVDITDEVDLKNLLFSLNLEHMVNLFQEELITFFRKLL